MKNVCKGIVIAVVLSCLMSCSESNSSWYGGDDSSNFQANDTPSGPKSRMKITRGSGYGAEVPFSSKYAS